MRLIFFVTNLAFYGRFSLAAARRPATTSAGWVIVVPVIGGLIVGVMARYGSKAIRGHGIPEAMEQVLHQREPHPGAHDVPQAAVGGDRDRHRRPVRRRGADHRHRRRARLADRADHCTTTARERKTLLAAGAAAGMAATFGSPVSAVLLAVELLLFEYRPRSLIPVALAAATAAGVRIAFVGQRAGLRDAGLWRSRAARRWRCYIAHRRARRRGVASSSRARSTGSRTLFEQLPIHWMWWPAIGARRRRRGRLLRAAHAGRRLRQHRATFSRTTRRLDGVIVLLCR